MAEAGSTTPEPKQPASRRRYLFWLAIALSWVALLPLLLSAVTSVPSAARLERSHAVPIPTFETLARVVLVSALEVGLVLGLLWPKRSRGYTARVLLAAALLAVWFVLSTPLALTRLEWVHRRWLALLAFTLLAAGVYALVRGIARKRRQRTRA